MTICIAALADNGKSVVMCADFACGRDSIQYDMKNRKKNTYTFFPNIAILGAGQGLTIDRAIDFIKTKLPCLNDNACALFDKANILRDAILKAGCERFVNGYETEIIMITKNEKEFNICEASNLHVFVASEGFAIIGSRYHVAYPKAYLRLDKALPLDKVKEIVLDIKRESEVSQGVGKKTLLVTMSLDKEPQETILE